MAFLNLEFLTMEWPAIITVACIFIFTCLIVYFLSAFSIKEKSFEEILEEQKKRSKEEELQQKLERSKRDKDKKFKKWGKKKEKTDHPVEGMKEPEKEINSVYLQQMSENISEIEIIEPKELKPKKKPKAPGKSNHKPDSSLSSEEVEFPELQKKTSVDVKMEIEPKKMEKMSKERSKPKKEMKDDEAKNVRQMKEQKDEEAKSIKDTAAEDLHLSSCIPLQASPDSPVPKKKRKNHSEKGADFSSGIFRFDNLVSFLKETEFDDKDSQMLIDVLLNKQKVVMGWRKKNDPSSVKKQLQDKEQSFELEHQRNQSGNANLKEEKNRAPALERHLVEKIDIQNGEIKTLTSCIKELQEQLNSEKNSSQEKLKQLQRSFEEKIESSTKKFQEEKKALQVAFSKLESSSQLPSKVDYEAKIESLQKSREDLQKVHNLLVEQHTSLISSHKSELEKLKRQLSETTKSFTQEVESLKKTCQKLKTSESQLEDKVKSLETDAVPNSEVELLKATLEERKKKCDDLETQIEKLTSRTNELMQFNSSQQLQIENLKQENERLSTDLASAIDQTAGDNESTLHQNGDLEVEENELQKSMNEKEIILQENEKLINQLHGDIAEKKTEIIILTEELEMQKQKNNELREKNWKAMEAASAAEKSAESMVEGIKKLTDEKILKIQAEAEMQLTDSEKKSLETSKLVEALKIAEKNFSNFQVEAEEKLQKHQKEAEENLKHLNFELERAEDLKKKTEGMITEFKIDAESLQTEIQKTRNNTKSCLQRIFPNIKVENSTSYDIWLSKFEDQAVATMHSALTDSREVEELLSKVISLQNEKEDLSKAVQQYKTTLADTERMLNELQSSVETEELLWKENLNIKEKDLEQALKEKGNLIEEIKRLQPLVQQVERLDEVIKEKENLVAEIERLQSMVQQLGKLDEVIKEKENLVAEIERLQSMVQQLGKLDEMQENLKLLQNTIETTENERAHLESKFEEVNKNYLNIQDQVKMKDGTLSELQNKLSQIEDSQKELEDVKLKLEKERKINKELSAQTVKLNSLVKIGQDSLKAEQDAVLQLQNQLEAQKKSSTANGMSNPSQIVDLSEDTNAKK